nr:DUF6759 domain-containing protein [uncultured Chryseobacterium sp.]
MRKACMGIAIILLLNSCEATYKRYTPQNNSSEPESEYRELSKTYKSETAEVLTYLLNEISQEDPKTALTVENISRCNMVLTVSSNNYFKKIPIAAGKTGAVMIPKNQTYRLSGMICQSTYQTSKFITSPYSVKISD